LEPIKKNGNLEAYSTVNNLYFSSFYEFSEDKYSKKPRNTSKMESVYFKNKCSKDACLERKFIK
jgi:hypothetical protein